MGLIPEGTVPIEERGGRRYPMGTVYYSKRDKAFYAAGYESQGPLTPDQVSGNVRWELAENRLLYRDQTGVFIPRSFSQVKFGVEYGSRYIRIEEDVVHYDPTGQRAGWNSEWIERFTVHAPDGRILIVEVTHGIEAEFNMGKQTKQWWRKMNDALNFDARPLDAQARREQSAQIQAMIAHREVIHRMNLGPAT